MTDFIAAGFVESTGDEVFGGDAEVTACGVGRRCRGIQDPVRRPPLAFIRSPRYRV
ncbi:hypothetical protein AB0O14_10835 [Microbacterium foliorum]